VIPRREDLKRIGILYAGTLAVCLLTTGVIAAPIDPPLPAILPMRDGSVQRGEITSYDASGVTLSTAKGNVEVKWADVKARTVSGLGERLIGSTGSARQWLELGQTLNALPDGKLLARRAFAIALRMDPLLKDEIDRPAPTTHRSNPDQGSGFSRDERSRHLAWPALSDEQRRQAVAALKQNVANLLSQNRARIIPTETRYFIFYSDLSPVEVRKWAGVLDLMYARLAALFGIAEEENIWHGKAAILVFAQRDDFRDFETQAFHVKRDAGGWCHYLAQGDVLISFFRASSDQDFARVLVHESTHGFLYRYRGRPPVPSWINEGLAEVMEFEFVPQTGIRQANDAEARIQLRAPDGLKGFFTAPSIEFPQYPIARTLTEFMIRQNKRGYVEFINGIKDGMTWEDALQDKYGVNLNQLVNAYGISMTVANLKPSRQGAQSQQGGQ
jgi:hypothetical protein